VFTLHIIVSFDLVLLSLHLSLIIAFHIWIKIKKALIFIVPIFQSRSKFNLPAFKFTFAKIDLSYFHTVSKDAPALLSFCFHLVFLLFLPAYLVIT